MSFWRKWAYYGFSVLELVFGIKPVAAVLRLFLGKPRPGLTQLTLRASGARMAVRSKMDAWSVKESFIDQFYGRGSLTVGRDWQVVDIGAAIGEFTVLAALKARDGRVYAFEPNPESGVILKANVKVNALTNVEIHQVGVWDKAGSISLDMSGSEPLQASSSTSAGNGDGKGQIQVITLKQVVEDIVQGQVDLLKLDCEGAEYPILLTSSPETMARIDRIVMEYHELGEGQDRLTLTRFLEGNGFEVSFLRNPVHAHLGYIYAVRPEFADFTWLD